MNDLPVRVQPTNVPLSSFVISSPACAVPDGMPTTRQPIGEMSVARATVSAPDAFATELSEAGVDVSGLSRAPELGTSKTVIVPVRGEDRRYIHTFGANAALCAEDLEPALSGAPDVRKMLLPTHHLTTHGVIVGMTGSGKTGLCLALLEEALGSPAVRAHPVLEARLLARAGHDVVGVSAVSDLDRKSVV